MDTSAEYIQMCEKAREIQEQFNQIPLPSDIYDKESRMIIFLIPDSIGIQNDDYVWLPRQDQLQKIIGEKWTTVLTRFIRKMTYCVGCDNYVYGSNYDKSMEQIWLMFVMETKYNKVWNGEGWVVA